MPHYAEEIVEVASLVPHERVQQRTAKQIEEVSQLLEETVEFVPQESVDRQANGGGVLCQEKVLDSVA